MKIKIKNARLSFPSVFRKAVFQGNETKYEATFLLDKTEQRETIDEISAGIAAMLKEHKTKLPPEKICLKDGDASGADENAGMMTIKASSNKRPLVIGKDKSPLTEEDNVIYSGCYVDAIITLWFQDNGFGKRVNASLEGVQFRADGEPFGNGGTKSSVSDFDVIDDDDNDSF
jgi:hypothetical protein